MRNEQLPVTVLSLSSPMASPMWRAGKILVRKREMRAGSTDLGAGGGGEGERGNVFVRECV